VRLLVDRERSVGEIDAMWGNAMTRYSLVATNTAPTPKSPCAEDAHDVEFEPRVGGAGVPMSAAEQTG
jgi:hypothetical protein